jgi:hypothetical protein
MSTNSWDFSVANKLQGIRSTGVLSDADISKVNLSSALLESNVFQNSTKFDGVIDLWLLLFAESYTLGIATSLHVEDSLISPNVLVITNEGSVSDSAQSSFSSS